MRITWDGTGTRYYHTGVSHGVVYPYNSATSKYAPGVGWNGLTAVNENPSGAEPTKLWADNIKYLEIRSAEEYAATIEAYTYPDEFAVLDGTAELMPGVHIGQQDRKLFGFCYRTLKGNDVELDDYGYILSLVYGLTASPSQKNHQTKNENPEAGTFSWEVSSTPVAVTGFKPTSILTIDSRTVDPDKLILLEDALYGTSSADAYLPLPDEVKTIMGGI